MTFCVDCAPRIDSHFALKNGDCAKKTKNDSINGIIW